MYSQKTDASTYSEAQIAIASLFWQNMSKIACTAFDALASCVCSTREVTQLRAVSLTVSSSKDHQLYCICARRRKKSLPCVVSEPLENRELQTARWTTGAGFLSPAPAEAQTANEGRLIQQHGYRSVLRNLELASTPQQASPVSLCTLDSILLRRQSQPVRRHSIFPRLGRGSFLHGVKLSQLRNNKQAPAGT